MATVQVNFGTAMGSGAPAYPKGVSGGDAFTSSGSNQVTTAMAKGGDFAHVTSTGGAVWVEIGQSPTAAAGTTWIVADGETKQFGPLSAGDKVAILDV